MARTGIKQDVSYYVNLRGQWKEQFRDFISSTAKADSSMKRIGETAAGFALGQSFLDAAKGAAQLTKQVAKMGMQTEGVLRSFNQNFTKEQFAGMEKATAGTVNQLELMQQAIKAKNFKIPIETLTKGLEFARKRAQDTGLATDYLVDSFVWGLGTQSTRVMDNLGISLKQLNAEVQRLGGDRSKHFLQAVTNIMTKEMKESGGAVLLTSERFAQMRVRIQNVAIAFGTNLLPLINKFIDVLESSANKIGKWIKKNEKMLTQIATFVSILAAAIVGVLAFGAVMSVLTNPIAWLIAGMATLGVIIAEITGKELVGFADAWGSIFKTIKREIELAAFQFQAFKDLISAVWDGLKATFTGKTDHSVPDRMEKALQMLQSTGAESKGNWADLWGKLWTDKTDSSGMVLQGGFAGHKSGGILDMFNQLNPGGMAGMRPEDMLPEGFGDDSTSAGIAGVAARAPATFHINIDRQIENFNVNTGSFSEGADDIREKLSAVLLDVINDIQRVSKNAR